MKQVKQRLEELRGLTYAQYLESPEWQETRKAAMKRGGNRCQICNGTTAVDIYHRNQDNRGCEQEGDLVLLCQGCYKLFAEKLTQSNQNNDEEADEENYPHFSMTKKAAVFGPTALFSIGLPALLHAPLPAEIVGLIGAIAVTANSPRLYAEFKDYLPAGIVHMVEGVHERKRERQENGEYNTWDKLLGRHLSEQREADAEQDDQEERESEEPQKEQATGPWVPPKFSLDDVLEVVYDFNQHRAVYFGNSEDGGVAIPLSEMYHVIDVSSSGKGKSNRFRLAMMQMVGTCTTYCINPLAANVKPVIDKREIEVWKPIYDRLANKRPIKEGSEIKDLLTTLVNEIGKRNILEEQYDFSWQEKPVFVFIDELPEVFARCPEALKLLDKIGRMGRQYYIFLWVASQTANVNDIGLSTPAQAQFKTRIYGGGDKTSAERMMKGSVPKDTERTLQSNGAGLTLILADNMGACTFTRSPLVTNEALFKYLGLPPFRKEEWMQARKTLSSLSPFQAGKEEVNTLPNTQESKTLPTLTIESVTAWYTGGQINQDLFVTLLKTITQPETILSARGNSPETAPQSAPNAQESPAFPVSDKNTASVSIGRNGGSSDDNDMETPLQADTARVIAGVFPASTQDPETSISRSDLEALGISMETVKLIKRMKEAKFPDRDISGLVELGGRRYDHYRQVLKFLGYGKEEKRA